jgi:hypothetical protein
MSFSTTNSAICFNNFKTAALYFDRVIPADVPTLADAMVPSHLIKKLDRDEFGDHSSEVENLIHGPSYRNVLEIAFGANAGYDHFLQFYDASNKFAEEVLKTLPEDSAAKRKHILSAYAGTHTINAYQQFLRTFGLTTASLFLPDEASFSQDNKCSDILTFISGLKLIDGENADLEQIVEIRKDANARIKLKRLRTFLLEKYKDKPVQFIEDDISIRIDDYENVARKHGFELVTSSLGAIIEAKNIHAALGAGLAGALLGGPISGITASVSLELGALALTIAKGAFQYRNVLQSHETAYIIEARKRLT